MSRIRLPDRRQNETREIVVDGRRFTLTVGFGPGGLPLEVFADGHREGSDMQAILHDACIVISHALQHGATPEALARSMCRVPRFDAGGPSEGPASPIGAILAAIEPRPALAGVAGGPPPSREPGPGPTGG
jgi:hypothetical protein